MGFATYDVKRNLDRSKSERPDPMTKQRPMYFETTEQAENWLLHHNFTRQGWNSSEWKNSTHTATIELVYSGPREPVSKWGKMRIAFRARQHALEAA